MGAPLLVVFDALAIPEVVRAEGREPGRRQKANRLAVAVSSAAVRVVVTRAVAEGAALGKRIGALDRREWRRERFEGQSVQLHEPIAEMLATLPGGRLERTRPGGKVEQLVVV